MECNMCLDTQFSLPPYLPPSLLQYNVFFNLCRLKGVHFDLQDKVGTAFMLVDSFAGGVLSLMTVGKDTLGSLQLLAEGLDFVQLQLGVNRSNSEKFLPEGGFRVAYKEIKARLESEVQKKRRQDQERAAARAQEGSTVVEQEA